jgi:hypothetical protein
VRDVLEEVVQVDLLLVVAAERRGGGLPHDGHHGLVVHSGVVQPVEEVDRPGAGSGQTHPGLADEVGMRSCHERGQL